MQYTVNTVKARSHYNRARTAKACIPIFALLMMVAFGLVIGVHQFWTSIVFLTCGAAFLSATIVYAAYKNDIATQYFELVHCERPKILGLCTRIPVGSHYDGIQEVFFRIQKEDGSEDERSIGLVREVFEHNFSYSIVDITRKIIYIK